MTTPERGPIARARCGGVLVCGLEERGPKVADVLLPPKGMRIFTSNRMLAKPGGKVVLMPMTVMAGSMRDAAQMFRDTVAEAWARNGRKSKDF